MIANRIIGGQNLYEITFFIYDNYKPSEDCVVRQILSKIFLTHSYTIIYKQINFGVDRMIKIWITACQNLYDFTFYTYDY